MRIKTAAKQPTTRQDLVCLSVLLTIALCIGIYLIATTVVISSDGVTFINYARDLEIAPIQTTQNEAQHPGYPLIILLAHKISMFFGGIKSVFGWIYSAQSMALIFRLFTVAVLYFIGKDLVGSKFSFWAILILVLLPKPAHYGSDALSDWPHLFFLTAGMLFLMRGAAGGKWWLFGCAGISAGMGFLIRPECAQIVVYGSLWLAWQLFCSKRISSRPKTVVALSLLLVGFFVAAGPYMLLKDAVFPKQDVGEFAVNTQPVTPPLQRQFASETANIVPSGIAGALGRLFENIGETLMWFFVPALLIGLHKSFRKVDWNEAKQFFTIVFAVLNIALMIWLYDRGGYMSARHSLPLIVFTIFYIPAGLQACASWLQKRLPMEKRHPNFWFFILVSVGIAICIPKLLRPLHEDKLVLRKASQWLAENTDKDDPIAVPDPHISFYSERRSIVYTDQTTPEDAKYIVKVMKNERDIQTAEDFSVGRRLFSSDTAGGKYIVNIYLRPQP